MDCFIDKMQSILIISFILFAFTFFFKRAFKCLLHMWKQVFEVALLLIVVHMFTRVGCSNLIRNKLITEHFDSHEFNPDACGMITSSLWTFK